MSREEAIVTGTGPHRFVRALFTMVLVPTALYLGRSVLEPITFVLFAMALVWPFQKAAEGRVGKPIALTLTIVLTLLIISILVLAIVWSISDIIYWGSNNLARLQSLYTRVSQWLEGYSLRFPNSIDSSSLVAVFHSLAKQVNYFVGFAIVVVLLLLFGLTEMSIFKRKIEALDKQLSGWSLLDTTNQIAGKIRKYMLIRTVASVVTGLAVFAFTLSVGLELAIAWGIISFVLNYIPYLGPLVAVVLPVIFAIAQFESWHMAAIIFGGLYVIQFLLGSYLEPMLTGSALAISPFVMLLAFFFWDFLWGVPGAFIGLPVTIALFTMWEQNPSTRWIAKLLSTSDAAEIP